MKRYLTPLLTCFCGLLSLLITLSLHQQIQRREAAVIQKFITEESRQLHHSLNSQISSSITALKRMAQRWEVSGGTEKNQWIADAYNYTRDNPALTTVEWVDNTYHVRWIEPIEGNEKALGLNIAFNEERRQALAGAAEKNAITLTPPLDLVQGYRAVIVYVPIHVNSQFDGFIVGIYDTEKLLNRFVPEDILNHFLITISDGDKPVYNSHSSDDISSRSTSFSLIIHNRQWWVTLTAREEFIQENTSGLSEVVLYAGILLSLSVTALLYLLLQSRQKREQLLRQQLALHQSEYQYQMAANSIVDGLIIIDSDGIVTQYNRACEKLFGYSANEIIGNNVNRLMPTRYADNHDSYLSNYIYSGVKKIIGIGREVEGQRKDGSTFPMELSVNEFRLSDKRYFIGTIRDITERKQIEDNLRQAKEKAEAATRQKSEFLANMSHEIRTPINGIIGTNHLLKKTKLTEKQQYYIETNQYSANILLRLINDILDFSKIEAGKLELEIINFDCKYLITELQGMFHYQCEQKELSLSVFFEGDDLHWVQGDPARLQQILINLINNAIKFTEQGHITIRIKTVVDQKNNAHCHIAVEDTGIGIPPDKQSLVFNQFDQADSSTTRKYGGTGLGLAICKQLVEMMGGKIGLNSEEAKGSTFWFDITLPIAEPEYSHTESIANSHEKNVSAGEQKHILLVEDNEVNQMIAASLLEAFGHQVTTAVNGQEAVHYNSEHHYDLILMDCQMPVMDGFEATRIIREQQHPLPIIALTANALTGDRETCLAAGMNDYISKPIDPDDLKNTLAKWLNMPV